MPVNQMSSQPIRNADVDVIIANRDGMPYLPTAVHSVLLQGSCLAAVHVVDGESKDGSVEFLDSVSAPRFSWSTSPRTLTPAARRNLGVLRTSAPFVMFLDSDDVLDPEAISSLRGALMPTKHELAVGGICRFVDRQPEPVVVPPRPSLCGEVEFAPAVGNVMFTRHLFDRVGNFNETLQVGEFVEWMSRLRANHVTEQKVQRLIVWRREHAHNWSRISRDRYGNDYPAIVKSYLESRKRMGSPPPQSYE